MSFDKLMIITFNLNILQKKEWRYTKPQSDIKTSRWGIQQLVLGIDLGISSIRLQ